MAFRQTLPEPTWSGFEAGCLGKFLEFVVKQRLKANSHDTKQIEKQISYVQHRIRELRRAIEDDEQNVAQIQANLAEIEAQLTQSSVEIDDETLESILASITDLPYVTRLSTRRGVLVVRMTLRQKWLYPVDLGEVEFDCSDAVNGWFRVGQVRKPWGVNGIYLGDRYRMQSSWVRVDMSDDISTTIESIRRKVEHFNRFGAWRYPFTMQRLRSKSLEFDADAVKAALKNVHTQTAANLVAQQTQLKYSLDRYTEYITDNREAIRERNAEIRTLRAQLAALDSGDDTIVVNLEEVADELRRIIALPGVMGLRFKKNGTPVFHVRASHLYGTRRYDVGDFEIRFKLFEDGSQAALNVHGTRVRNRNLYYHPEDRASESWFCFGSRAREAQDMFSRGHYAAMMGLLINSLNSINQRDRSIKALDAAYHQIPVGLVWEPAMTFEKGETAADSVVPI